MGTNNERNELIIELFDMRKRAEAAEKLAHDRLELLNENKPKANAKAWHTAQAPATPVTIERAPNPHSDAEQLKAALRRNGELRIANERLVEEVEELREDVDAWRDGRERTDAVIDDLEETIVVLDGALRRISAHNAQMKRQLSELGNVVDSNAQAKIEYTRRCEAQVKNLTRDLSQCNAERLNLATRIETLEGTVRTQNQTISLMEDTAKTRSEIISKLNDRRQSEKQLRHQLEMSNVRASELRGKLFVERQMAEKRKKKIAKQAESIRYFLNKTDELQHHVDRMKSVQKHNSRWA